MHSRRARSVLFSRPKSNASASEELGVAPGLIDQFLGMLIIGPVRNSQLVNVSFTSKSPVDRASPAGFAAEIVADYFARVAPEIETASFRTALEALTNVSRHAHAKQVSVKLERDDCGIALVIRATFPAVTSAESDH